MSTPRGKPIKGHPGLYRTQRGRVVAVYRGGDGRERSKAFDRIVDAEAWRESERGRVRNRDWVAPEAGRVTFAQRAATYSAARVDRRPSTIARDEAYLRSLVLPYFAGPIGRYAPGDCRRGW